MTLISSSRVWPVFLQIYIMSYLLALWYYVPGIWFVWFSIAKWQFFCLGVIKWTKWRQVKAVNWGMVSLISIHSSEFVTTTDNHAVIAEESFEKRFHRRITSEVHSYLWRQTVDRYSHSENNITRYLYLIYMLYRCRWMFRFWLVRFLFFLLPPFNSSFWLCPDQLVECGTSIRSRPILRYQRLNWVLFNQRPMSPVKVEHELEVCVQVETVGWRNIFLFPPRG